MIKMVLEHLRPLHLLRLPLLVSGTNVVSIYAI